VLNERVGLLDAVLPQTDRPRHEIISMLVRKELIFLLIRPVLVKVDRFSDEQAGRQAGRQQCYILPPATSLHWQQLVKGDHLLLHYSA